MLVRFRSRWQNRSKRSDAVVILLLVVSLLLIVVVIIGYRFNLDWTGLGPYISPPHSPSSDFQRGKTLWDWLQLLIIPAVLAVGGYLFNYTTSRTEREIASDGQREEALQAYIDKISELLLHEKLRELEPEYEEVRKIARVRTLTLLPRLDKERKKSILQFLYESGLIEKDKQIIDLSGANLREANLREADLSGAYLRGAILRRANLFEAILREAYLREADLSGANLRGAKLRGATLFVANLHEADLSGAILSGANLFEADLSGAILSGAILSGAFLSRANLSGADLRDAKLIKAELRDADLRDAKLIKAELHDADLRGADLRGAIVTPEQLDEAWSLTGAVMPDGLKLP